MSRSDLYVFTSSEAALTTSEASAYKEFEEFCLIAGKARANGNFIIVKL
jgi:hypothetical protein